MTGLRIVSLRVLHFHRSGRRAKRAGFIRSLSQVVCSYVNLNSFIGMGDLIHPFFNNILYPAFNSGFTMAL